MYNGPIQSNINHSLEFTGIPGITHNIYQTEKYICLLFRDEEEDNGKEETMDNEKDPETTEKEPWVEVTPEDAETARQEAEQAELQNSADEPIEGESS